MVRVVVPDESSPELVVLSAESTDFSAVWLARCLELVEFGREPLGLVAQGQDMADSGEVEALGEEAGDVGDPVDVGSAVPASAAACAERAHQTSLFVDAQHLRVDSAQLRGDRDGVD